MKKYERWDIMNRENIMKILLWLAVISWMIIIFNFSSSNGEKSDGQSRGFLSYTILDVASFAQNIGIRDHAPSENNLQSVIEKVNPFMRKIAHATVYFVLAFLLLLAFHTDQNNFWRSAIITVVLCFLYSLTDEFHQTLVPGRAGVFTDCLIDTSGAIIACFLYRIAMLIYVKIGMKNTKNVL